MNEDSASPDGRIVCPKCGSPDVRRSKGDTVKAGIERMFGRWPFRCRSCRAKFYSHSTPPEEEVSR